MQGLLLPLSIVASAAVGILAQATELKVDVTLPVECDRKTKAGDNVEMHYRGTLAANGKQFDASYDRGTPFTFRLGAGQVIKGWDEGLQDMCIGEKRTLTIPPSYGYGSRNMGPIPANSVLIFETELLGIKGVPKPESIKTKATKAAESAASTATDVVEEATAKLAEKIASKVGEAAGAAYTVIVDSDDGQEHEEL